MHGDHAIVAAVVQATDNPSLNPGGCSKDWQEVETFYVYFEGKCNRTVDGLPEGKGVKMTLRILTSY